MALRLSKDLRNTNASEATTSFDVTGQSGQTYNLDDISNQRNRSASDTELLAYVDPVTEIHEGNVGVREGNPLINTNSVDYGSYLLNNDPSSPGYVPTLSYRRPIVLWEDGTEQPETEPEELEEFYNKILTNANNIEALRALLIRQVAELREEIANKADSAADSNIGSIVFDEENNEYGLSVFDTNIIADENSDDEFGLRIGGTNNE